MADPIFWLGLSILLVAVSLTAVLIAALPALRELARAARSAEKLFDTLSRELPPTLEAIRLTGMEISDLTDDMSEGVQSAKRVAQQVDQSLRTARRQAQTVQSGTRSLVVGFKAAWRTFQRSGSTSSRRSPDRLPPGESPYMNLESPYETHDYEMPAPSPQRDRSKVQDGTLSGDSLEKSSNSGL